MNYQGNIDAYYAYAKENRKVSGITRKRIFSGILLFLLFGFLIWAYFNIFHWDKSQKVGEANKVESHEGLDALTFGKTSKIETLEKEQKLAAIKASAANSKNSEKAITPTIKEEGVNKEKIMSAATSMTSVASAKVNEINGSPMAMQTTQAAQQVMANASSVANSNLSVVNTTTDKGIVVTASEMIESNISTAAKAVKSDTNGTTTANSNVASTEPKEPMQLYHLYIVQKGETLYDIARKQYNDKTMYVEIINANPDFENPDEIKVGQEILLPIVDEAKSYSQILNFK